ncbi:MAG: 2-amino-4-hydroxy-6-hydroxymethyldihydropteridine diphosphokinase [Planctomycetaceae bacterium]|jgi:2-amino-4-hydroxy-6-hydroxymethyldihydropteridine diphosphokinase|nr:2-amino-4-hydroxy-6-hydroxymethyldihydropteridine diphosphokinase [Planctomycetaceae bacterium]
MPAGMMNVLLAFGSNLGYREENVAGAWKMLGTKPGITPLQLSPLYETEPVGGPASQGLYINAAGMIQTSLLPLELLRTLQQIESAFGRIRLERWGARTLDIDILLYGNAVINTPELTIPHPEMLHRQFVLTPAQDIAADWVHPVTGLPLEKYRLVV